MRACVWARGRAACASVGMGDLDPVPQHTRTHTKADACSPAGLRAVLRARARTHTHRQTDTHTHTHTHLNVHEPEPVPLRVEVHEVSFPQNAREESRPSAHCADVRLCLSVPSSLHTLTHTYTHTHTHTHTQTHTSTHKMITQTHPHAHTPQCP